MTSGKAQRRQAVLLGSASGLVVVWFAAAASFAIGTLWSNGQGPFDPAAAERLDFWSGFCEGASALFDPGRLWRLSSPVFWLVLVALVALTILRWERLARRTQTEDRWLPAGRLLWLLPWLAGLAWSPPDAYAAMAALYSMHLLNTETVGAALGEALAAPWIGLLTAASLGLASIFYRFAEPPRLKVWRRLTLAVIVGALSTIAVLRLPEMAEARTREVVLKELRARDVADGRIHWREDVLAAFGSGLLPEKIYRVGGEVAAPEPVETPAPPYPEGLAETGSQAYLLLDLVIDAQGKVREVWTYERLPLGFGEAITKTVRTWRYRPAMRGDEPVAVYYTAAVRLAGEGRGIGGAEPITPAPATVMACGRREILVFALADGATSLEVHRTEGGSSVFEVNADDRRDMEPPGGDRRARDSRTAEFLGLEQPSSGAVAAVARARADGRLDVWQIGTDAEAEAVEVAAAAIRVLLDLCGTGLSFETPVLLPSSGVDRPGIDRDR